MSEKPFPAGLQYGAAKFYYHEPGGWQKHEFYGEFDYDAGTWLFKFCEDELQPTGHEELWGRGKTPRQAFESLVLRWTAHNRGNESRLLSEALPWLRSLFETDGSLRPERIEGKLT